VGVVAVSCRGHDPTLNVNALREVCSRIAPRWLLAALDQCSEPCEGCSPAGLVVGGRDAGR
jgi:hypothetical protein